MKVSVICPVYNTDPALLDAAVNSVLSQGGDHAIELIIVDDASTNPATVKRLRRIADEDRARVLFQPVNRGPAAARMAGVAQAQADWLGFIDSDDLWPANKLDLMAETLAHQPEAGWICGRYHTVYHDREVLESSLLEGNSGTVADPAALTRRLIRGMPPLGASLVRPAMFAAAGGLDPRLTYGEDWLFYLRLSTIATVAYANASVYRLRRQYLSLMWSFGRMSNKYAAATRLARRDPRLKGISRELRWYLYANYKDIAMNNQINGRPIRAVLFALRALMLDPREVEDFRLFCKASIMTRARARRTLSRYSSGEQVLLDGVPALP